MAYPGRCQLSNPLSEYIPNLKSIRSLGSESANISIWKMLESMEKIEHHAVTRLLSKQEMSAVYRKSVAEKPWWISGIAFSRQT